MALFRRERGQKDNTKESSSQDPISHFQELVEQNPNDPQALFNLGSAYFVMGQWDESAKELERAVARDPKHLDSRYYLGLIYARRGEREKARQELEYVAREDTRLSQGTWSERQLMLRGYAQRKLKQLGDSSAGKTS